MKRIIILSIVLVVFTCAGAWAESSVWKAQKGSSIIYLGGTCHILRESDYPLPPEFDAAYRASDIVVFETDISAMQDPATQQKFLAKATYADGSSVDKHLSSKTYAELKEYCDANDMPLELFKQFKPALLVTTLTVIELMKLGASQQGVDQFFSELAKKDQKTVETLETVDEQIEYVMSMADGNEDEFVRYSIKDMKTLKTQFDALADAWRAGDVAKLNEIMVSEIKTRHPKIYKKLITDRNRNWLALMDAYLKQPKTKFVLVGAAHLVGPDGIIAALKKKGYKIDQL